MEKNRITAPASLRDLFAGHLCIVTELTGAQVLEATARGNCVVGVNDVTGEAFSVAQFEPDVRWMVCETCQRETPHIRKAGAWRCRHK